MFRKLAVILLSAIMLPALAAGFVFQCLKIAFTVGQEDARGFWK